MKSIKSKDELIKKSKNDINIKSFEETKIGYSKNSVMNNYIKDELRRDFWKLMDKDKCDDILRDAEKDGQ